MPAQREDCSRALPRVMRALRRRRIDQQAKHGVLRLLLDRACEADRWYRRCRRRPGCPACRRAPPACPARRARAHGAPPRRRCAARARSPSRRRRRCRAASRTAGLRRPFLKAIAEHRHAAFLEVRHREAGREREHATARLLELSQFRIDALARLDERALRRDAGEVVERVEVADEPLRRSSASARAGARRARRCRPCRRADRCGTRPSRPPCSTIARVTLACRSRLATIGTRGPTAARTRRRISPSPSSCSSDTMAPCRSR